MKLRLSLACLAAAVITGLVPVAAGSASAAAPSARAAAPSTVNWPGFHDHATDTGYNPGETTIGPGNAASLHQQWLAATTAQDGGQAPTIAGGRVFTTGGHVQAWNASTGAPEWSVMPPAPVSSAAYGAGEIFVDSGVNGGVYAYGAADGKLLWSHILPGDGAGTEPVFWNGLVYVAGYFSMNAYDATTGAVVWTAGLNGLVRSVPAVANGRLFLATECCTARKVNFLALDARTGAVLWKKPLPPADGIQQASPVADATTVYQCSGGTLYALWVKHGYLRWSEPDGCDIDSTPALANGVLYAASQFTSQVYAISASTGAIEWSAAGTGSDNAAPAVANGVVYVPMQAGTIAAYAAATGALLWTSPGLGFDGGDPGASEPAVANGLLYAGGTAGLYAFAASG